MYRLIMVPLDGSARAERILPHVEDLAAKYNAAVLLLHAVAPITEFSHADLYIANKDEFAAHFKAAESYLEGVRQRLSQKGIDARVKTIGGTVVEAIIQTAEREQVDLIAMASHGRTGASRVFYGSVAAGVLHRIDRPLLIIRSRKG
jgi:nucleotide-binding universal stress UspA family protein